MSETVIPQSSKQYHPGKNQKYVGSREGGHNEAVMTKNASIKHHNPEYFKRQQDRKHSDSFARMKDEGPGANGRGPNRGIEMRNTENVGRGEGQTGRDSMKKDNNIPARKDVPIQRDFNHHQKNVGNDPGRGVGNVGMDNCGRKHMMDNNSGMMTPQTNRGGTGGSSNPIRKSASPAQTNLPGGKKTDQNQMQMKQFTRGTIY